MAGEWGPAGGEAPEGFCRPSSAGEETQHGSASATSPALAPPGGSGRDLWRWAWEFRVGLCTRQGQSPRARLAAFLSMAAAGPLVPGWRACSLLPLRLHLVTW